MKKTVCFLMVLVAGLLFFAAYKDIQKGRDNAEDADSIITEDADNSEEDNVYSEEDEDKAESENIQTVATLAPTAEPTPAPTPVPTATPDQSYTVKLKGGTPVHSGPGRDYAFVQSVGQDGTYTIVQESTDADGKLWGKLKSGMGWVNITDKDTYFAEKSQVWAYFADKATLDGGYYERYNVEDSEYTKNIAFRIDNDVKNIRLTQLSFDGSSYKASEPVYKLAELPKDNVLVLGVVFHGDSTTYGFEFADVTGQVRKFSVSLSGKDGSLVFKEY